MMGQDDKKLVLVNKHWHKSSAEGKHNFFVGTLMWLILASLIVLPILLIFLKAGKSWGKVPLLLLHAIKADPEDILLLVAMTCYLFILPVYQKRASASERLILSKEGIRYTSPLSGMLKRFKPDWTLAWSQVSKIEIVIPSPLVRNPELIGLTLTAGQRKRKIIPIRWINPETYSRSGLRQVFELFKIKAHSEGMLDIKKSIMASEVIRYIVANVDIPISNAQLDRITVPESLEKDPHGRIAVFMVLALLGYTVIDIMLGPESYVNDPIDNLGLYLMTGTVGAILSGLWLSRSELSSANKAGLAVFIGIMVGVAMVPGALRINVVLDKNGSGIHDYRVTQGDDSVVLQPLEPGWPKIDYFAKDKYWKKFGKGDVYPVEVRKGILGFYQFNSSVIVRDIKQSN